MLRKYDYDTVVIGAGISGLVCGCYLAKAGLKTIIVEKNSKPGGYCTSFARNGFKFDACAHSLGSLRKGGNISNILKDLDLDKRFKFVRNDPQDVIITPDYKLSIWNDLNKTIKEFQNRFPKESANIESFLSFLNRCSGIEFNSLKNITFQILLNKYFKDEKLKSIFAFLIFGNIGLPPSKASALTAVTLYKEFILDGGYYPDGGMQSLSDILGKKFEELGGNLSLSSLTTNIKVIDNKVEGITVWDSDYISAKYVVTACDATEVFSRLIEEKVIGKAFTDRINKLTQSLSAFVLYIGVDKNIKTLSRISSNIWYLPNYDIEKLYHLTNDGDLSKLNWFLMRSSLADRSITVLINASFKDIGYWEANKKKLIEEFVKKVEKIFPDLSHHVTLKDAATPNTLYKWTLNHKGAAYGWESTASQFAIQNLSQVTSIRNLYTTGHWATLAQGIPGVAYLGKSTAKLILSKEK